jgi:hypothetical protein
MAGDYGKLRVEKGKSLELKYSTLINLYWVVVMRNLRSLTKGADSRMPHPERAF